MLDKGLLHLWLAGGLLDGFCRTGIEPHPKALPGTILNLCPNKSAAGKNFVRNPGEECAKNREAAQASAHRRVTKKEISQTARRLGHSALPLRLLLHQKTTDDKGIHAGREERADGVGRRVDDGFAAKVEAGVHDDRHAGNFSKLVD